LEDRPLFCNPFFFRLLGTAVQNKEIFRKHAVGVGSSRLRNTKKFIWPLTHLC